MRCRPAKSPDRMGVRETQQRRTLTHHSTNICTNIRTYICTRVCTRLSKCMRLAAFLFPAHISLSLPQSLSLSASLRKGSRPACPAVKVCLRVPAGESLASLCSARATARQCALPGQRHRLVCSPSSPPSRLLQRVYLPRHEPYCRRRDANPRLACWPREARFAPAIKAGSGSTAGIASSRLGFRVEG